MLTRKRTIRIGATLAALGAIGLAFSATMMARRLANREDLANRPMVWFGKQSTAEAFTFNDHHYTVTQIDADGVPSLRIEWRGRTVDFPINTVENKPQLPGLLKHEDWFKIIPMAVGPYRTQDDFQKALHAGEIKPRLIAAARYTAEGFDPEKWGSVRRREWRYRFVEFLDDKPAEDAIRVTETTYKELDSVFLPGPHDKAPETPMTDEQKYSRLWEYYAMLQVTPPTMYRAKDKLVSDGMHAMGWTWPAAGASTVALVAGLMLVASTRVSARV